MMKDTLKERPAASGFPKRKKKTPCCLVPDMCPALSEWPAGLVEMARSIQ